MKNKTMSAAFAAMCFTAFGFVLLSLSIGIIGIGGTDIADSGRLTAAVKIDGKTSSSEEASASSEEKIPLLSSPPLILIDAGHGGEDGGASSVGGVLEKDLNLSVSRNIASLCLIFGIPYEMTRDEDTLLYDRYGELESYEGRKKSLDLKNRLRMAEELDTVLFLSIHMNKFPSEGVKGFQVYYSNNSPDSAPLAESVQSFVKSHVQPYNERVPKAADSSIYLLKNINTTAILTECGFLSNVDEANSLSSPSYQLKLAASIFVPSAEYFVRCNVN